MSAPFTLQKRYDPVERCIYCNALRHSKRRAQLAAEHIIPASLGGIIELPEASCGKCEGVTSSFDGWCARPMLGALRCRFGLYTRRPEERPKTLPLKFLIRGNWETKQVPIELYPVSIFSPYMKSPELLEPVPASERSNVYPFQALDLYTQDEIVELCRIYRAQDVEVPPGKFRGDKFSRMLAKIGHSYAAAELGLGSFKPLLIGIICGQNLVKDIPLLIGGIPFHQAKSDERHELSLQREEREGVRYIVVKIRLFADFGMPVYYTVAGIET